MFEWIIKKREKIPIMPNPKFDDNWMADKYQKNVKEGVTAMQMGKTIKILDDGRGYELACDIKRQFILEYQKQLSERIRIDHKGSEITISIPVNK